MIKNDHAGEARRCSTALLYTAKTSLRDQLIKTKGTLRRPQGSIFQLFLFLYCCLQNANKEPWICQIWATNLYRSVCHSYNDTLRAKSCTWASLQEICCFFICIFVKSDSEIEQHVMSGLNCDVCFLGLVG